MKALGHFPHSKERCVSFRKVKHPVSVHLLQGMVMAVMMVVMVRMMMMMMMMMITKVMQNNVFTSGR